MYPVQRAATGDAITRRPTSGASGNGPSRELPAARVKLPGRPTDAATQGRDVRR